MAEARLTSIAELLMRQDSDETYWPWMTELGGRAADEKTANKFLFGCIVDSQRDTELAWRKVAEFIEGYLDDPQHLWQAVVSIVKSTWESADFRRLHNLHRFPERHNRLRQVGIDVLNRYDGDARSIWREQPARVVLQRLKDLHVGPQLSRMAVGGLYDTGQIDDATDLKADLHTRRVLGRIVTGEKLSADETHRIANEMLPGESWLLDGPLFNLGRELCKATPNCERCQMETVCKYADLRNRVSPEPEQS